MHRLAQSLILVVLFSVPVLSGCHKKEPTPKPTLSQASQKFAEVCRSQHKLPVQVFEAEKTVWIYLPMEEDLVDYKGAAHSDAPNQNKQFVVSTFEGLFQEPRFKFAFDITSAVKTIKDPGYKSEATEAFMKKRLLLYGTLGEAYLDLEGTNAPDFFVVTVANVKKGVAYKTVFNMQDYKYLRSDVIPFEEYNLREINELYGDANLVNDWKGTSLEVKPVTWPWFFIEQAKNRVGFKFTRSDFPPDGDVTMELASILANMFRYYSYTQFEDIQLADIRTGKEMIFTKAQLATFRETPIAPSLRGRRSRFMPYDLRSRMVVPSGSPKLDAPAPADSSSGSDQQPEKTQ